MQWPPQCLVNINHSTQRQKIFFLVTHMSFSDIIGTYIRPSNFTVRAASSEFSLCGSDRIIASSPIWSVCVKCKTNLSKVKLICANHGGNSKAIRFFLCVRALTTTALAQFALGIRYLLDKGFSVVQVILSISTPTVISYMRQACRLLTRQTATYPNTSFGIHCPEAQGSVHPDLYANKWTYT